MNATLETTTNGIRQAFQLISDLNNESTKFEIKFGTAFKNYRTGSLLFKRSLDARLISCILPTLLASGWKESKPHQLQLTHFSDKLGRKCCLKQNIITQNNRTSSEDPLRGQLKIKESDILSQYHLCMPAVYRPGMVAGFPGVVPSTYSIALPLNYSPAPTQAPLRTKSYGRDLFMSVFFESTQPAHSENELIQTMLYNRKQMRRNKIDPSSCKKIVLRSAVTRQMLYQFLSEDWQVNVNLDWTNRHDHSMAIKVTLACVNPTQTVQKHGSKLAAAQMANILQWISEATFDDKFGEWWWEPYDQGKFLTPSQL